MSRICYILLGMFLLWFFLEVRSVAQGIEPVSVTAAEAME